MESFQLVHFEKRVVVSIKKIAHFSALPQSVHRSLGFTRGKSKWARPDLVFNDGLATPIFDGITLLQEFVNGFEHLNEDLMLDEEPDVYVLSKR